jgi:hypothetical protein
MNRKAAPIACPRSLRDKPRIMGPKMTEAIGSATTARARTIRVPDEGWRIAHALKRQRISGSFVSRVLPHAPTTSRAIVVQLKLPWRHASLAAVHRALCRHRTPGAQGVETTRTGATHRGPSRAAGEPPRANEGQKRGQTRKCAKDHCRVRRRADHRKRARRRSAGRLGGTRRRRAAGGRRTRAGPSRLRRRRAFSRCGPERTAGPRRAG